MTVDHILKMLQNMSSTSPELTMETHPTSLATSAGASVMLIFFTEGMLGNIWILIAIITNRKMWTVINVFIASLLVNDILSLCLIVVLIIDSYIWKEWTAGEVMCKLNPEFTVAFIGSSLWHTALIAIHRYIVVVHNSAYKNMKKSAYVVFVLVVARAIPIAVTVPGFSMDTSGYMPKMLRCILLPTEKARIISVTVVQVIVPCIVVVLCYAFIFGYVYRMARQLQDSNMILKREIQITKMFGVIFLVILLGFVPYTALRNADRDNRIHADVYVIVTVFYGVASCSSPLVYGIMSKDIRDACLGFLTKIGKVLSFSKCCRCQKFHDGYAQPTTQNGEAGNNEMITLDETGNQV